MGSYCSPKIDNNEDTNIVPDVFSLRKLPYELVHSNIFSSQNNAHQPLVFHNKCFLHLIFTEITQTSSIKVTFLINKIELIATSV